MKYYFFPASVFENKKIAFYFFCALIFVFYPIMTSGFLQNDDIARSLWGYYRWRGDGRVVSDILIKSIVGNGEIVNAGPYFQILAVFLAALSCYSIFLVFNLEKNISSFFSVVLLFCTTNILENISYVYDSYPMFASVLFSVIALYFCIVYEKSFQGCLISALLLFLSLNSYQASVNIFLVYSFMYMSIKSLKGKAIWSDFLKTLITFFVSLVAYKISVLFLYNLGEYAAQHANSNSILETIISARSNFFSYFNEFKVLSLFNSYYLPCVIILFLAPPILIVLHNSSSIFSKLKTFTLYIFAIFSTPGVLLLLNNPIIVPRTLISIGSLLSSCAIFVVVIGGKKTKIFCFFISAFVIVQFSFFSYALGSYQRNLEKSIEQTYPEIVNIVNYKSEEYNNIYVLGQPVMYQVNIPNNRYKVIMEKISYQPINYGNWWGYVAFVKYGFNNKAKYVTQYNYNEVMGFLKTSEKIFYDDKIKMSLFKRGSDLIVCFNRSCGI